MIPDADVVKVIVGKDRYIPLVIGQSVVEHSRDAEIVVTTKHPLRAGALAAFLEQLD
jgi:hypothetical protein